MSSRGKAAFWAVLPLLLLTAPMLWLGRSFANQLASGQRLRAQHTLDFHAEVLQRSIDRIGEKLESLKVFVAGQTAGGKEVDGAQFSTFASGLHASSSWIRAFQIVSDGVITHTYPLKGNETVLGHNLLMDPRPAIGADVTRALRTGRAAVSGPLDLVQGGLGIIVREPVPRADGAPARLVAIVLNIGHLLDEAGIGEGGDNDFLFAIRRESDGVFFGPPAVFEHQPVVRRVSLPDGSWEVGNCPREGWQTGLSMPVLLFYLTGAAMIFLLCLLVFVLARSRASLSETVRERTDALRAELTARNLVEDQLRQNYSLLVAVTEGTSDAVFVKDLRGCYQMINSAGAAFLGRAPEAIIGKADQELFSPETAGAIMNGDRKVIESGQVLTLEERGTIAGVTRTLQATKAPWRDKDGNIIGVVGVSRDITESKAREREIEQFNRLYAVLSHVDQAVMHVASREQLFRDICRTIVESGRFKMAWIGWRDPGTSLVVPVGQFGDDSGYLARIKVFADDRPEGCGPTGTAIRENRTFVCDDFLTDQRTLPWREAAASQGFRASAALPIRLRGEVPGVLTIYAKEPGIFGENEVALLEAAAADISFALEVLRREGERLEAEHAIRELNARLEQRVVERTAELSIARDRAEAADRLKSAFLATMSHELRTPLNSIIGFTGIILQGLPGPLNGEQHKQLEMVRGSARHLLALINDVLDISKIEAGQLEVVREPFDLRASIGKVVGIIEPLAGMKGLALHAELAPDVGRASSDQRRVEQVLLNLLNNAVKFTERGEVNFRVWREESPTGANGPGREDGKDRGNAGGGASSSSSGFLLHFEVRDTGIGIKPGDLDTLFKPFRQIDAGLTRQHEGTGLGLAICRRLAELMGGEIRVASEWGKGSVFTFILPGG